ncbi:hypothetical protein SH668x_001263 [Planctomicrobium sp. SH668]|uniref:hypothetical protein n=1 Tax=Planctomicrobium sp. SH668 TaxID=3448126 RepID=UPI003F5BA127
MVDQAWIENLKTRRMNITSELAAMDNLAGRTRAGSKPDQSGEAGGTAHTDYRRSLLEELREINQQLKDAAEQINAESKIGNNDPFTIEVMWDS